MESRPGSYPVWSSIPGIQEVYERVDRIAGEYGEVYAVTGERDDQVRGESDGRS